MIYLWHPLLHCPLKGQTSASADNQRLGQTRASATQETEHCSVAMPGSLVSLGCAFAQFAVIVGTQAAMQDREGTMEADSSLRATTGLQRCVQSHEARRRCLVARAFFNEAETNTDFLLICGCDCGQESLKAKYGRMCCECLERITCTVKNWNARLVSTSGRCVWV